MQTPPPSPWRRPDVHAARRPRLLARGAVTRAFRGWFEARGFVEVETAALQISPGNETHLHAFATQIVASDGAASPLYLRTSPEFACKKLLAAGEPRLFDFARVWRNRERGPLHAPEFTLLEWYRADEPYETLMEDCAALIALAAETAGARRFSFRGRECDPFAAPERITVAEAFARFAACRPDGQPRSAMSSRPGGHRLSASVSRAEDDSWSDVFSRVIIERIEPALGIGLLGQSSANTLSRGEAALGAAEAGRSAGGRAVRGLCLRCRAGQLLRRTH